MASSSANGFAPENETLPSTVIFEPNDQQLIFSYLMKKVSDHDHAEGFHFIETSMSISMNLQISSK